MQYSAAIENRKSVRAFLNQEVRREDLQSIRRFYETECHRLVPEIPTELTVLDLSTRKDLEGAAGYEEALVGAPHYLVLLSGSHPQASENAGFMMEDMLLKLEEMGLQSCWITFTDPEKVKAALDLSSSLEVAAIAAFGYGVKQQKKMRLNIFSMSCVDIIAKRGYYAPKKDIRELVFVNELDNIQGLDERIGFYDDMLWQAFYGVSKAPSYLNRQPYAFILKNQDIVLVKLPDPYTDDRSHALDLGIALLHFTAVAEQWVGKINWDFSEKQALSLPEGCFAAAVYHM